MLTRDVLRLALTGALLAGCTGDVDEVITPVRPAADDIVMGNLTCAKVGARVGRDLGDFEVDVAPGPGGTFRVDDFNEVTLASEDGVHLDWAATTGMDAVLVRGGDGTAVYAPGPEMTEGHGLTAPMNWKLEEPYAISGVTFCYDHELEVSTSLATFLTRTYAWSITNTGAGSFVRVAAGKVHWMPFTVDVARAAHTDSDWTVRGVIAVTNPAPYPATIVGVEAWLGKWPAKVECDAWLPARLDPGATTLCRYARTLEAPMVGTAHAIVRTSGYEVGPAAGVAGIDFARASVKERDATVSVWDRYDRLLGTTSKDATFVHALAIGPYDACGAHLFRDTAAVVGVDTHASMGASWDVIVDVPCK